MLKAADKVGIKGKVRFIFYDVVSRETEITEWHDNLIPTVGLTAIVRRMRNAGTKSNEGIITYGAVGTGATTPAKSDTILATELKRKLCSTMTNILGVLTVRTYFTTSEANGTLTEFGLFGEEATSSADTGTLFERVTISRTKTSAKTLTVESVLTFA